MSTDVEAALKLQSVAMEVYSEHGVGDDAIAILQARIVEDSDLLTQALREAARNAINVAVRLARSRIAGETQVKLKSYSPAMREAVETVCGSVLEWRLLNGLRLAEATKDDLLHCSKQYQTKIDGSKRNQKFVELVAE